MADQAGYDACPPPIAQRSDGRTLAWSRFLAHPGPEPFAQKWRARLGGMVAVVSVLTYLTWRVLETLPQGGIARVVAIVFVSGEALGVPALLIRIVTLWDLGRAAPAPVQPDFDRWRIAVLIPTYNEPAEVIAPTIAASVQLAPRHETWVLDDGDRPWVRDLAEAYGARYVCRPVHDHAKAGNINHALALAEEEAYAAGGRPLDIVAVLDCDHVPLEHFLTSTLGWFDDPEIALVQGPQTYYNAGAFDDDGFTGEQGLFFHVLLPGRNKDRTGPFWCGSTSLIRVEALAEVGGVATETIVEDMHTTLKMLRRGWKTAYHHQTLALGLAPETADQYLLQRRRWGMGCMQVLVKERLWAAKAWLNLRNYYEYLSATVWWLEGLFTFSLLLVPIAVLPTGLPVSTAPAGVFLLVFMPSVALRLWGSKLLYRGHLRIFSALSLRVMRVPVGVSCAWWLLTRRELKFEVTSKSGESERVRGRVPSVLWLLLVLCGAGLAYAVLAFAGLAPRAADRSSLVVSAVWILIGTVAVLAGIRRVRQEDFLTSRRNAHRVRLSVRVVVSGAMADLEDVSLGGAAVRVASTVAERLDPDDKVNLILPDGGVLRLLVVRVGPADEGPSTVALKFAEKDWASRRNLTSWLFRTPVPELALQGAA